MHSRLVSLSPVRWCQYHYGRPHGCLVPGARGCSQVLVLSISRIQVFTRSLFSPRSQQRLLKVRLHREKCAQGSCDRWFAHFFGDIFNHSCKRCLINPTDLKPPLFIHERALPKHVHVNVQMKTSEETLAMSKSSHHFTHQKGVSLAGYYYRWLP